MQKPSTVNVRYMVAWRKKAFFYSGMSALIVLFIQDVKASSQVWTRTEEQSSASKRVLVNLAELFKENSWEEIIDHMDLPSNTWGLSWLGSAPFNKNEDLPKVPASVLKIVTATTALRVLGPGFKFTNTFSGKVMKDTSTLVQPEWVLSSDPTWAHGAYEPKPHHAPDEETEGDLYFRINQIIDELKRRKITQVSGPMRISYTRPELATFARPKEWKDKASWWDGCGYTVPTEVMISGNCATFQVTSENSADWLTEGVSTPIEVDFERGERNHFVVKRVLDELNRVKKYKVSGIYHTAGARFTLPVHNNEQWLKNLFLIALKRAQIKYSSESRLTFHQLDEGEAFSVDLSSKTLAEILPEMLRESINLIADRLFLEVRHHLGSATPEYGEMTALAEVTQDVRLLEGVKIYDGSGLVPLDRLTAKLLWVYLEKLKNESYFDLFLRSLSIAGMPESQGGGTLSNRLSLPVTRGKVFAKTGTLDEASNLAGYYRKPNDELEPFVVLSSPKAGLQNIDKLVTEFAIQNSSAF